MRKPGATCQRKIEPISRQFRSRESLQLYRLLAWLIDSVMLRARELFKKSGMTLDELGQKMGCESGIARTNAWQFLNKTSDPRLSMLLRFAEAVGIGPKDVL